MNIWTHFGSMCDVSSDISRSECVIFCFVVPRTEGGRSSQIMKCSSTPNFLLYQLIFNADFFFFLQSKEVWIDPLIRSNFSNGVWLKSFVKRVPLLVKEQDDASICWWTSVHLLTHERAERKHSALTGIWRFQTAEFDFSSSFWSVSQTLFILHLSTKSECTSKCGSVGRKMPKKQPKTTNKYTQNVAICKGNARSHKYFAWQKNHWYYWGSRFSFRVHHVSTGAQEGQT